MKMRNPYVSFTKMFARRIKSENLVGIEHIQKSEAKHFEVKIYAG